MAVTDDAEVFKAGVHLAVLALAASCAAYNTMRWTQRWERHSAGNAILYTALAIWEGRQIVKHLERVIP